MTEQNKSSIIDRSDMQVANIVESNSTPGVFGIVALGPDGKAIGGLSGSTAWADLTGTPTALLIDQTTPQSIVNGAPKFLAGIIASKRVASPASAVAYTPAGDDYDAYYIATTEGAGTLTMNAVTGTPTNFQKLQIIINATAAQTFSWNAIYRGSTDVALPTTIGAGKVVEYGFEYHTYNSTRDLIALTIIT